MNKSRPIVLYEDEVFAIRAGGQDQLRRPVKPQPLAGTDTCIIRHDGKLVMDVGGRFVVGASCPFGRRGDSLWVKEAWVTSLHSEGYEGDVEVVRNCPAYRADGLYRCGKPVNENMMWWSPVLMPRWASRLTLEIVHSGVMRLQNISSHGVLSEGYGNRGEFAEAWDKRSGNVGFEWGRNPWVWVAIFARKAF